MGEWIYTSVRCDNSEVLRQCALAFAERDREHDVVWEDGDALIETEMWNYVPSKEIKSVSINFPDDNIICEYTDAPDGYIETHYIFIKNGNEDILPPFNYSSTIVPVKSVVDQIWIWTKARNFFEKLDPEERDKDGNMSRNWFPEKVSYEFDCVGEDGITVRVIATKCGHKIGYEVYKDGRKYDWRDFHFEEYEDGNTYDWADFDGKAPSTLLH